MQVPIKQNNALQEHYHKMAMIRHYRKLEEFQNKKNKEYLKIR